MAVSQFVGDSPPLRPVPAVLEQLRPAFLSVLVLTLLTGVIFPLAVAPEAWLFFPRQSGGSLILRDGIVGSELIGQDFTGPGYFHPRPCAAGRGYDATACGGTNLGPANPKLRDGTGDDPASPDVDESFAGSSRWPRPTVSATDWHRTQPFRSMPLRAPGADWTRTSVRPTRPCRLRAWPEPAG
jgi:hypothetical protein